MKLRKGLKNTTAVELDVLQTQYEYFQQYCEFFIQKCDQFIDSKKHAEMKSSHFTNLKSTLENIMFTLDVGRNDKKTTIQIPTVFLDLLCSLAVRWDKLLNLSLDDYCQKLKTAINGENKRQFTNKAESLRYLIELNKEFIAAIKECNEG